MDELKVTSIAELKKMANGEVVELPGFTDGTTFVARLKRPSMLAMAKMGKIPNNLLGAANKLFIGVGNVLNQNNSKANSDALAELFDIIEIICEECFVEPTYKDLKDNGIELTDQQKLAVFTYTQRGVKSLESFRG